MFKQLLKFFRKEDELLGIWTREDDSSGLLNIFGWSLHFLENGEGKRYSWENDNETISDFEWQREDKKKIKLRIKNNNWEIITYETQKYIGSYKSKQTRLIEANKNKFWNFREPLYKHR